jgi:hypothetical protein
MIINKDKEEEKEKLFYKGKEVYLEVDVIEQDEDVTKLGHFIKDAESKKEIIFIDWSPYDEMTIEDTKLYIDLGCPKRIHTYPLNREDLQEIKKRKEMKEKLAKESIETDPLDL